MKLVLRVWDVKLGITTQTGHMRGHREVSQPIIKNHAFKTIYIYLILGIYCVMMNS